MAFRRNSERREKYLFSLNIQSSRPFRFRYVAAIVVRGLCTESGEGEGRLSDAETIWATASALMNISNFEEGLEKVSEADRYVKGKI